QVLGGQSVGARSRRRPYKKANTGFSRTNEESEQGTVPAHFFGASPDGARPDGPLGWARAPAARTPATATVGTAVGPPTTSSCGCSVLPTPRPRADTAALARSAPTGW